MNNEEMAFYTKILVGDTMEKVSKHKLDNDFLIDQAIAAGLYLEKWVENPLIQAQYPKPHEFVKLMMGIPKKK